MSARNIFHIGSLLPLDDAVGLAIEHRVALKGRGKRGCRPTVAFVEQIFELDRPVLLIVDKDRQIVLFHESYHAFWQLISRWMIACLLKFFLLFSSGVIVDSHHRRCCFGPANDIIAAAEYLGVVELLKVAANVHVLEEERFEAGLACLTR